MYLHVSDVARIKKFDAFLFLSALLLFLVASVFQPINAFAKTKQDKLIQQQNIPDQVGPDTLLTEIFKSLKDNNLKQAQLYSDQLVELYPNFQLGHLIRGDILYLHSKPITGIGNTANGAPERIKDLRDEAMVRIRAHLNQPSSDSVPKNIIQLKEDQKQVIIIDARNQDCIFMTI